MNRTLQGLFSFLLVFVWIAINILPASAQEPTKIQHIKGRIEPGEILIYLLTGLNRGDRLYIHAQTTSGNLDPIIGILDPNVDPYKFEADYKQILNQALLSGTEPQAAIEEFRNKYALAWDDDGGGGLTSALSIEIPADGEYRLLVAGSNSLIGEQTFGDFLLRLGLNAQEVLSGESQPTGDIIAEIDHKVTPTDVGVDEFVGSITPENRSTFIELQKMDAGDTLYVHLEAISGNLVPLIILSNFSEKPVRSAQNNQGESIASLEYTFPQDARNYRLEISACCELDQGTYGDYRLLVGVNEPKVLSGLAEIGGRPVLKPPTDVKVGFRLEQIIEVNQQSEFFSSVGSMQMEWIDPA